MKFQNLVTQMNLDEKDTFARDKTIEKLKL